MGNPWGMELRHYSTGFTYDRHRKYEGGGGVHKPAGFWVSVQGENDWVEWCEANAWGNPGPHNEHVVTLDPQANVLLIESREMLDSFTERLTYPLDASRRGYAPVTHEHWDRNVKPHWDGVIIAPYQWRARRDVGWYYGWDCASGVIWNLDAIESVVAAETVVTA